MIALASAPNLRDLGGMRAADGRQIRPGLIFRSEAVLTPTDEDARALDAIGIVLICDLRSAVERHHAPNAWWAARGVACLDLDILAGIDDAHELWSRLRVDPGAEGALALMHGIYQAIPAAAAPHIVTVLHHIAAGDVPLLIHCTAGKDRTGFLSAVILDLMGVDREDIMADYLASLGRRTAEAVAGTRRMLRERVEAPLADATIEALMGVDRSFLDRSFARIAREHGDTRTYLAAAGLDEAVLEAVRARLLG